MFYKLRKVYWKSCDSVTKYFGSIIDYHFQLIFYKQILIRNLRPSLSRIWTFCQNPVWLFVFYERLIWCLLLLMIMNWWQTAQSVVIESLSATLQNYLISRRVWGGQENGKCCHLYKHQDNQPTVWCIKVGKFSFFKKFIHIQFMADGVK